MILFRKLDFFSFIDLQRTDKKLVISFNIGTIASLKLGTHEVKKNNLMRKRSTIGYSFHSH